MTVVPQGVRRRFPGGGGSGTLYDVLDLILDRGLVIDVFVRVSLVGIEIEDRRRVVVASVDTYLRFAEACNRLDLGVRQKGARPADRRRRRHPREWGEEGKSKGALGGAMEAVADSLTGGGKKSGRPTTTAPPSSKREGRRGTGTRGRAQASPAGHPAGTER